MAKPPVLVTGGLGYIGGHTARALLDEGERVIILDNLSNGSRGALPPDASYFGGGIEDEGLVHTIVRNQGVEDILHLAASVDVVESERDPEKYFKNNRDNTMAFVRAALAGGAKRIVFSSTAAVYSSSANAVSEDSPLGPVSNYGKSKLEAERAVREAVSCAGRQCAILRYFNVAGVDPSLRCGYRTDVEPTHLIRRIVRVALGLEEHLTVFGTRHPTPDGTCIRDYVHVEDVARAHLRMLRHLREGGESEIYNVGLGRGYSVLEVHAAAQQVAGKKLPLRYGDPRPGDPPALIARAEKICRLGWMPRHDLAGMIRHELAWVVSRNPALMLEE